MPGRVASDQYAAVAAKRLGDDGVITLVAGHDTNGEIMLVRPDAHLGWRGRAEPDATAVARIQHGPRRRSIGRARCPVGVTPWRCAVAWGLRAEGALSTMR